MWPFLHRLRRCGSLIKKVYMRSQNQDTKKNRTSILKSKKVSQILANKTAYRHTLRGCRTFPGLDSVNTSQVSSTKLMWDSKNKQSFEGHSLSSLSSVFTDGNGSSTMLAESKRLKKAFQKSTSASLIEKIIKPALKVEVAAEKANTWVLNKVHPHHYSNILGYRKKSVVVNPNITLQGVRRVLHYLKTIIKVTSFSESIDFNKVEGVDSLSQRQVAELIVVVESSMLSDTTNENAQASAAALISHSLLRLQEFSKLKVTVKTAKETISYLASSEVKTSLKGAFEVTVCGVLILNPAKSVLGSLADTLFNQTNKKDKKMSAGNAIGSLCAKKGIPLISLCDVSSPVSLCTYPIVCDTRNLKSVYLVLDLLTYGLNRLKV